MAPRVRHQGPQVYNGGSSKPDQSTTELCTGACLQFTPLEQGKSLQLALLLLPARWKQRVSGPVGLGMVPRSAGRTETMGHPSCSRQGLKPGWAGHGFIFCSLRSAKLKPWDSRLFPTGLGPQGETPRAKIVRTTVVPPNKTSHPIKYVCTGACLQFTPLLA